MENRKSDKRVKQCCCCNEDHMEGFDIGDIVNLNSYKKIKSTKACVDCYSRVFHEVNKIIGSNFKCYKAKNKIADNEVVK